MCQVHAFYQGLVQHRKSYTGAYEYAKQQFQKKGFIIDDPDRYEVMCMVHDRPGTHCTNTWACRLVYKHNGRPFTPAREGAERFSDYDAPVVHGIPAYHHDSRYSAVRIT